MPGFVAKSDNEFVLESAQGQPVLLRCSSEAFEILKSPNALPILSTASTNLLRISVARPSSTPNARLPVTIAALVQRSGELKLWKKDFWVSTTRRGLITEWAERILDLSFQGGKGNARALVQSIALPILESAGLSIEVYETQHAKHGEMLAQDLLLDFDVIAAASGDGLIHEIINGLAVRSDAKQALRIPVVQIPTGSANGFCLNALGLENGFSIPLACLNVIKGKRLPLDVCSNTQGSKRWFSYMSLAAGLMMEVDLKTEHLRWMGDARFIYGFIRGGKLDETNGLHLKVVNGDKALMIKQSTAHRERQRSQTNTTGDSQTEAVVIPPPRNLDPNDDWVTITSGETKRMTLRDLEKANWKQGDGIWYIYTGMQPFVSRDLMQFPVAIPGEGLIDVVVQSTISRTQALSSIDGGPEGKPFHLDSMHYYKVSAYILEPLEKGDLLSLDGEAIPFERITVEMIPKMATTMTLTGCWPAVEHIEKGFKMVA
ncbi:hypothetical protein QFC21_006155 [Naganishia friedmannii]|uniref:Uncharacterized protein n=1 Tax=Naganishia friedmannii TaxID=89922 RepID=A0ACC2V4D7_9TREE|nr:hypothetical protein QFC21_006155 [Naganishia friedmannii]